MKNKSLLIVIKIVALIFALMYIKSAYDFIFSHEISFVNYAANSPAEIWVVRNLGIRLLAIGIGFLAALALKNYGFLALMFAVRLVADVGDLFNSIYTPNLENFVTLVLTVFVIIELTCFLLLIKIIKQEKV